ncbi:MAG TPA: phytanoyl-CoA dioxygenase family protein [Ilumatobacteraceae bacterium]|nr:phytanoyl-CoA dioxygenase family protein [Ilumatobacteraceae bacterium]
MDVSDAQVAEFRDDGVTLLRHALDQYQLADLAEAVDENMERPGEWSSDYTPDGGTGRFFGDYVNWDRIDAYRRVAMESSLPAIARRLMGSTTVRFFHEHILVKEPGTAEITPWHHDQPYYCVDGDQNVSLWISLDSVPASAGVEFLVGSHRWGRSFVPRKFVDSTAYAAAEQGFELVPDIESERDAHRIVTFDVDPGDVIAFSFRILHAAPGTAGRTAARRRAVSLRYLGDDAVFATRPWLHSPPFEQGDLIVGGPLDDARFPLVDV